MRTETAYWRLINSSLMAMIKAAWGIIHSGFLDPAAFECSRNVEDGMSKILLKTRTSRVTGIGAKGTSSQFCMVSPTAELESEVVTALLLTLSTKLSDVDSTSYASKTPAWKTREPGHPMDMVSGLSGLDLYVASRLGGFVSAGSAVMKRERSEYQL